MAPLQGADLNSASAPGFLAPCGARHPGLFYVAPLRGSCAAAPLPSRFNGMLRRVRLSEPKANTDSMCPHRLVSCGSSQVVKVLEILEVLGCNFAVYWNSLSKKPDVSERLSMPTEKSLKGTSGIQAVVSEPRRGERNHRFTQ